jgi:hypothetical protein
MSVRTAARPLLQERLEATRAGRWLITAFLLVTLVCLLIANLPEGRLQTQAASVTERYMSATGLSQRWRIFAPNPRSEALYLEARVVRADGSVSIWRTPTDGPLIGQYRDYHWRKFVEHAVLRDGDVYGDGWPVLWRSIAMYAARQEASHGARPVRVVLVRRSALETPPGKGPPYLTPYVDTPYYTLVLPTPIGGTRQ